MKKMLFSELLEKAAINIEENAEALREARSFCGHWVVEDRSDEHAEAEYGRDIELVEALREAAEEMRSAESIARNSRSGGRS